MKCGFCGSDAFADTWNKQWFVRCQNGNCGAIGPWGKTQREAETRWSGAFAAKSRNGLSPGLTGKLDVDAGTAAERLGRKLTLRRFGIK